MLYPVELRAQKPNFNFISRRHGGREGLTIFASSRRQTLGSVFVLLLVADKRSRRRESAHRQWETAEKLKSKSGYATIGDIIERYQSHAEDRPPTIRNNISALRMLVRTIRSGDPDLHRLSILTGANTSPALRSRKLPLLK